MLKTIKVSLLSCAAALAVSSCGGGGGSSDSGYTPLNPKPAEAYNGIEDPALLDTNNTPIFASLVVGNSGSDTQSRASGTVLVDQPEILSQLKKVVQNAQTNPLLQGRTVSDTVACDYGGEVSIAGEISDEAELGTLVYTYKNCQIESGAIANGQSSETRHSDYNPERSTLAYEGFNISQDGRSYEVTGTVEYSEQFIEEGGYTTQVEQEIIDIASVYSPSGASTYLKDYTINYESNVGEKKASITGKVYLSGEGYVTVSTSSDYLSYNGVDDVIPKQGTIFITGASTSVASITGTSETNTDISEYRLDLDEAGDGVFELTSIQNNSDTLAPLTPNQAPVAVIYADEFGWYQNSHNDAYQYTIGTVLYLHSESSYDEDSSELSYVWTVEEHPEGSTANILASGEGDQRFTFTPDVKGDYKISLKVTDDFGSQQSGMDFINVTLVNIEPSISLSYDYDSYYQISVGNDLSFFIEAFDGDSFDESVNGATISYTWLNKPEDSLAEFTLTDEYSETSSYVGLTIVNTYNIHFDKAGTYKAEFKITDSDGASSTEIMEVNVRSYELTEANFTCSGLYSSGDSSICDWESGQGKAGEEISINFVTDSYLYSACFFGATSVETDSTGVEELYISTPSNLAEGFSFAPLVSGDWNINIQCTSAVDESTTYSFDKVLNFTY